MLLQISDRHSRTDEKVKVIAMDAREQERRVQTEIARRAYEIFKSRGSSSGHELEDWRQAEADVICLSYYGRMAVGAGLWIGTDAEMFEEGSIEILVSARRITICGKQNADKKISTQRSIRPGATIFQVINLGCEVDPSGVKTRINGPSLEILLRTVQAASKTQLKSKVAAA
jgi:Protein of unknown function (DUF2934)